MIFYRPMRLGAGAKTIGDGAHVLDVGPASSHPDAGNISPDTEIERLSAIWPELQKLGAPISVDSFQPATALGDGAGRSLAERY